MAVPDDADNALKDTTLKLSDVEVWMEESYMRDVASALHWDPPSIFIPPLPPGAFLDAVPPQNPGHIFMSWFHHPGKAAEYAYRMHLKNQQNAQSGLGPEMMLFSKTSPYHISLATASETALAYAHFVRRQSAPASSPAPGSSSSSNRGAEYSIFVGDLALDVTHHDLLNVFRHPESGLKADRGPPRTIRPFASCRSAKIMMSPETGQSRGFGFVRFGDEADQRRALIEMQGLYCRTRPMRISHATAKAKGAVSRSTSTPPRTTPSPTPALWRAISGSTLPPAPQTQARSISGPAAASSSTTSAPPASSSTLSTSSAPGIATEHRQSLSHSLSANATIQPPNRPVSSLSAVSQSSGPQQPLAASTTAGISNDQQPSSDLAGLSPEVLSHIVRLVQQGGIDQFGRPVPLAQSQALGPRSQSVDSDAPQRHASTSGDEEPLIVPGMSPEYNTTVFIGGLSSLIPESTLEEYFKRFGKIHYVKIPSGKGCGFVQYENRDDAQNAINEMNGFMLAGARIRTSWGRSQYKAAQAAVQAGQLGIGLNELATRAAHGGVPPASVSGTERKPTPPKLSASTPAPRPPSAPQYPPGSQSYPAPPVNMTPRPNLLAPRVTRHSSFAPFSPEFDSQFGGTTSPTYEGSFTSVQARASLDSLHSNSSSYGDRIGSSRLSQPPSASYPRSFQQQQQQPQLPIGHHQQYARQHAMPIGRGSQHAVGNPLPRVMVGTMYNSQGSFPAVFTPPDMEPPGASFSDMRALRASLPSPNTRPSFNPLPDDYYDYYARQNEHPGSN